MGSSGKSGSVTEAATYSVRNYGAVGDGVTDDTAAIKSAVNAAYAAGVANSSYYAEVYFPPGAGYLIGGSLVQGGSTHGNAQIPLPAHPTTSPKFTLVLRGGRDGTSMWHWQQTAANVGGSTLRSTVSGTNHGTYGEASVIGGPTPAQGYGLGGTFSNMLVVVDGVRVVVPNDPHICGFDLAGVAECNVVSASCLANAYPPGNGAGAVVLATQTWQFGLRMCDNDNNDLCLLGAFSGEGMNFCVVTNEHTVANLINAIYCVAAVEHGRGADTSHGAVINYVSAESCNVGLGAVASSYPAKVRVQLLDWEGSGFGGGGFAVVNDASNWLLGDVHITQVGATNHLSYGTGGYTVNGATNIRVYDDTRAAGDAGSDTPAVPASNTDLRNPLFRDCMVVVTGGTVTAIKVNGVTQGITSGTVLLGTGQTITLTHSSAPSWKWTLL